MAVSQKDIMKTAATQLRELSKEVQLSRDIDEKMVLIKDILLKTAENESVNGTFEKISEYLEKNKDDLIIIQKAVELNKTGELNLGSLSTEAVDIGELDPLTALLVDGYLQ